MTRTSNVKNLEEGHLYGLVANANEHKFGVVQILKITGDTAVTIVDGDEYSDFPAICGDVYGYVRTITPIDGGEAEEALVISIDSVTVTIPAGTPSGRGFPIDGYSSKDLQADPTITSGGVAGYIVEVVYVPIFASDDKIDYVTDFGRTFPDEFRGIYYRGELKHRKRIWNLERTLSFTASFLSFEEIMHQFANLEHTLLFERKDDGGATITEKEYYGKCFAKEPDLTGTGGDTDTTSATTVRLERWMTVENTPTA